MESRLDKWSGGSNLAEGFQQDPDSGAIFSICGVGTIFE
jgi:hypothetical protein